jgi:hypothetical protein
MLCLCAIRGEQRANGCYDGFMNRLYTDLPTVPVDSCAGNYATIAIVFLLVTADRWGMIRDEFSRWSR